MAMVMVVFSLGIDELSWVDIKFKKKFNPWKLNYHSFISQVKSHDIDYLLTVRKYEKGLLMRFWLKGQHI